MLRNGTTQVMHFNPRREPGIPDGNLGRCLFNLNGNDSFIANLSTGIWYRGEVLLKTGSGSYGRVIDTRDESLVGSINYGSVVPQPITRLDFGVDEAGANLSETDYRNIAICSTVGGGLTPSSTRSFTGNYATGSLGSFGLAQALTTVSGTGGVGTILLPSGPHLTKLQTYFDGNDSTDISYYLNGAGTIVETGTGSGITITGNKFHFYAQGTPSEGGYMEWNSAEIGGWGGPITIEWFAECISNKNLAYSRNLLYGYNSADLAGTSFEFGYQENVGYHVLEVGGTTYTYGAAAGNGRTHHAFVFGSTQRRYYIDGVLEYSSTASPPGVQAGGIIRLDGTQYNNNEITETTIDEFRIRYEEVYTGSSFTPPTNLPAPD